MAAVAASCPALKCPASCSSTYQNLSIAPPRRCEATGPARLARLPPRMLHELAFHRLAVASRRWRFIVAAKQL